MGDVKAMYQKIKNVATSPDKIIIYCNEDTMKWNLGAKSWVDTGFTYKDKTGHIKTVSINTHVGNQAKSPGEQGEGASYSTLGKSLPFILSNSPLALCFNAFI